MNAEQVERLLGQFEPAAAPELFKVRRATRHIASIAALAALVLAGFIAWSVSGHKLERSAALIQDRPASDAEILRNLLRRIDSDSIEVKTQALDQLKARCLPRMSILRKEMSTVSDAIRPAINKVCTAALDESTRVQSTARVSLDLKGITARDAFTEFEKQISGCRLDASDAAWTDVKLDELKVVDKPWREALETLLSKVGGGIEAEAVDTIRLSRPARMSFIAKDESIATVLGRIAQASRMNIIIGVGVKGTVSMTVEDKPWPVVLDTVVKTLQFQLLQRPRGICRVEARSNVKLETRRIQLKNLAVPTARLWAVLKGAMTLNEIGALFGSLTYDVGANEIVVTDETPVLKSVEDLIKKAETRP